MTQWSPFELAKFSTKILSWTFSNKNECLLLLELLLKKIKKENKEMKESKVSSWEVQVRNIHIKKSKVGM